MLTHAMSSNIATATIRTINGRRTSPSIDSRMFIIVTSSQPIFSGCSRDSRAEIAASSSCNCGGDTPALRRAMRERKCVPRPRPMASGPKNDSGIQTSIDRSAG